MKKKTIIICSAVAVIAAVAAWLLLSKGDKNAITFETAKVERSNISTTITATGTIEAVTTVDVGTQVSGIVNKIYVDYNSVVKKGQVIAVLDQTNLQSELASAQANLASAQANVRSAQSELTYQQKNFARYKELHSKQLVATSEYDVALESYRKAQESFKSAQQSVTVAQQSVSKAKTNLGYATITSPIDGVVISKEVEEGQTVASSFSTPTLFTIAKDLTDMQCIADVDEADIGGVREGQRVTFTVDAYPDDVFSGLVKQVRQNATTTNNVVTYEVVISAPNSDLKLKPGLTANVTIFTSEANDVLSIPTKALRFTPTQAMLAEGETIADVDAPQKVWQRKGSVFQAIPVTVGATNGTTTQILSGLSEGDEVLTAFEIGNTAAEEESGENNPFMPGPRNNNKNKEKNATGNTDSSGGKAGGNRPAAR